MFGLDSQSTPTFRITPCFSIRVNLDSDSNVTTSTRELIKQDLSRISKERGMQIDFNEYLLRQFSSIHVNLNSDSNVMLSTLALQEQDLPRISKERGMQINFSEQL
jgi:hypothetical protein